MIELPAPDSAARAHCESVVSAIRAEIERAGGYISFARYMELALYAPGLGYYAAGSEKLGAAGDFTTAPEMTPLFGATVAEQVARILSASVRQDVLELGGGTGRLATSLLRALADMHALPERYMILEPSPDLRARQRELLERELPQHVQRVHWLDQLPARIDGAVLVNEVLDAIAVHVLRRQGDALVERGVTMDPDTSGKLDRASYREGGAAGNRRGVAQAATDFGLRWAERPAPASLMRIALSRLPEVDDYTSEVNPAAEALVQGIAQRLQSGAALFIDYGFPAREYYHPQRTTGTLMCHYRHRAHGDPFFYPGLGDITAHVDFSAMATAAARGGCGVAGFCAQAPFLLSCGLLERLAATGPPDSLPYMASASQVQKLVSPAEMGELFKVLAITRTDKIDWRGFAMLDHQHRL
ncbi:MAG: SAM-dependent methyltransferase [Pseudomonadota bacterium]|nr:SAM-dependent methyltransferase [Pseudomonadota bacterium]